MGLFSSEKKTIVGTTTTRVVETEDILNSTKAAMLEALLSDGNIPEYLVDNILHGPALRFEKMYRYGRDKYHYGLPDTNILQPADGEDEIKSYLSSQHGGSKISLRYLQVGTLSNIHFGRGKLVSEYGYDEITNIIGSKTTNPEEPIYLEDMVAFHSKSPTVKVSWDSDLNWGDSTSSGSTPERDSSYEIYKKWKAQSNAKYDPDAPNNRDGVEVTTSTWNTLQDPEFPDDPEAEKVEKVEKVTDTFFIPLGDLDLESDYVQTSYTVEGDPTIRYWTYELNTGISVIDDVYKVKRSGNGTFFPFMIFRNYGQSVVDTVDPEDSRYKTLDKMLSIIGIDFEMMSDSIHENPDIDDVEQAVLLMGCPLNTEEPLELLYLYRFFKDLYEQDLAGPGGPVGSVGPGRSPSVKYVGWSDADLDMGLTYNEILVKLRTGKVAEVGEVVSGTTVRNEKGWVQERDKNTEGNPWVSKKAIIPIPVKQFKYQISNNVYEEVSIVSPLLQYNVYKKYHKTHWDHNSEHFIIPVNYELVKDFSYREKEIFYSRSLHFIFNSRIEQKVKWYQRGWFTSLLSAVATFVAFYFGGPRAGMFIANLMNATLTAALVAVLKAVAIYVTMSFGLEYVVDAIGSDFAFVAAVVAIAAAVYQMGSTGSIQGAPFASELLQAATGIVKAIGSHFQTEIEKAMGDYGKVKDTYEALQEELDETKDLLDSTTPFNPLIFVAGETPEEFYQRSIHSGNIGVQAIESISTYVDEALQLPTTDKTIQGGFYA